MEKCEAASTPPPPCLGNPELFAKAQEMCNLLDSEPFSSCYKVQTFKLSGSYFCYLNFSDALAKLILIFMALEKLIDLNMYYVV